MSVLRSLESKIADLVEGTFGRAFRSGITPVELARRLVREMDRNRQSTLSSTIVPNEYVVWLSPEDRRHFAGVEASLLDELAAHLLEHARAERLALPSRPHIELRTDRRLSLGECGIEATLTSSVAQPVARRYGVPPPARPSRAAPPEPALVGELLPSAWLEVDGQHVPIGAGGALIGRSGDCDIVIAAQEVSRRHAQVTAQDGGWTLTDLDSTNGVRLNGRTVAGSARLRPGDVIEIGAVELSFEVG
jgi:hypothetical protein